MEFTDAVIARVAHAANMEMQAILGDDMPSVPWLWEPWSLRLATANGVQRIREHGATVQENHEDWCADKHGQGWVFGPVKDPVAKTHPCLVPWAELPESARRKALLFHAIVTVLSADMGEGT